jgi:hypothetical protein
MAAARNLCTGAASVLHIGAEKFMLIRFDNNGNYHSSKVNTSCAAGTGSFLDQQAVRLNLTGVEELCERARNNTDEIPGIASRCAVFSRTDIIHAQQRGYSVNAICDSLCKGLAENIFNTVFNNQPPALPLFMTGGVSKNSVVRKYLENELKTTFLNSEDSHLVGAIGAALLLLNDKKNTDLPGFESFDDILAQTECEKQYFHRPLSLTLSKYPDFSTEGSFRLQPEISSHPSEVEADIYTNLYRMQPIRYMQASISDQQVRRPSLLMKKKDRSQACTPIQTGSHCLQ